MFSYSPLYTTINALFAERIKLNMQDSKIFSNFARTVWYEPDTTTSGSVQSDHYNKDHIFYILETIWCGYWEC